MNPNHSPVYQHLLLTQRANLLAQIAAQRGGTISRADVAAEHFEHAEDPRAQVLTARELEFAVGERELLTLTQIDAALERIQVGHYGLCVDCGEEIAPARLHATPEAARCLHCQEKHEHTHVGAPKRSL